MKTIFTLLSFILIVLVLSCERNETEELPDKEEVELSTDKNSYMNLQDIAFELSNNAYNNLSYLGCFYSDSPVFEIEKYENEEWIMKHYSICVEYNWHNLPLNDEIVDTIQSNWFDAGKYRLKCHLMKDSLEIEVYSNMFEINNGKEIEFSTDKNVYYALENITIKFQNYTSSDLFLSWCRLYCLERYEDSVWKTMDSPPCPYDGSFIVYKPDETFRDTIPCNWLDIGKYRLATFSLRMDTTYFKVYSNEFDITDFGNFIN